MTEKGTETIEQEQPNLDALKGTGLDIEGLSEQIKKESKGTEKPAEAATEAAKLEAEEKAKTDAEAAAVKLAEEEKVKAEAGLTEEEKKKAEAATKPLKVGDEALLDGKAAPDGEYSTEDGSTAVVKDGKVLELKESIVKEVKDKKDKKATYDNPFVTEEAEAVEKAKVELKDFEQTAKYLSDSFGVEVKTFDDIKTVVEKHNTLNEKSGQLEVENSKLKQYQDVFETMPDEIFSIVEAWIGEKDFHQEIENQSRANIDFSMPVGKQDIKKVVEYYNPGKFSDEDYQDIDDDKAMQSVVILAKKAYEKDQETLKGKRAIYKKDTDEANAKFVKSVEASVGNLSKSIPFMKEGHKAKISKILQGGHNSITGLFFNEEGFLKEDAGKLIALALYGEEAIKIQSEIASRKGESKANEQVVTRSATKDERKIITGSPGGSLGGEKEAIDAFTKTVLPGQKVENPFLYASVPKK